MTMTDDLHMAAAIGTETPVWLTPTPVSAGQKNTIALAWSGEMDARFIGEAITVGHRLDVGDVVSTNYYFTVRAPDGPVGGNIPFQPYTSRLREILVDRLSEAATTEQRMVLEDRMRGAGGFLTWTDGMRAIVDDLRQASEFGLVDLGELTIVGRPGRALLTRATEAASSTGGPSLGAPTSSAAIINDVLARLRHERNVIVEGVAGSGKSHLLETLRNRYATVEVVVFHPSTDYESFVAGLRPADTGGFVGTPGVFLTACMRAAASPTVDHLLFIDEINRANAARVFGDLMLPLEGSKRVKVQDLPERSALFSDAPRGILTVRLQTPVTHDGQTLTHFAIPDNLHVLGTMNSTDRSVGRLDVAMRRRFAWMEMEPLGGDAIREDPSFAAKAAANGDDAQDWEAILSWFSSVNEALMTTIGPDARLGHAPLFAAVTPLAAARALASQLAEVTFTFDVDPGQLDVTAVELPVAGMSLSVINRGLGLGRRTSVREDTLIDSGDSAVTAGSSSRGV